MQEPPKPEVKENKGKASAKKKDQGKEDPPKKNDSALEAGKHWTVLKLSYPAHYILI